MKLWYKFSYNPQAEGETYLKQESVSDEHWTEMDQKESLVWLKTHAGIRPQHLYSCVRVVRYNHGGQQRLWIVAVPSAKGLLRGWITPYNEQCNPLLRHLILNPHLFESMLVDNRMVTWTPPPPIEWFGLESNFKPTSPSETTDPRREFHDFARPHSQVEGGECDMEQFLAWDKNSLYPDFWINRVVQAPTSELENTLGGYLNLGAVPQNLTTPPSRASDSKGEQSVFNRLNQEAFMEFKVPLEDDALRPLPAQASLEPFPSSPNPLSSPQIPVEPEVSLGEAWFYYSRTAHKDYGVLSSAGPTPMLQEALQVFKARYLGDESLKLLQESRPRLAIFKLSFGEGLFISRTSEKFQDIYGRKIREYIFLPLTAGLLEGLFSKPYQPNDRSFSEGTSFVLSPAFIAKAWEEIGTWREGGFCGIPLKNWRRPSDPTARWFGESPVVDYPGIDSVPPWKPGQPIGLFRVGFSQQIETLLDPAMEYLDPPCEASESQVPISTEDHSGRGVDELEELKRQTQALNERTSEDIFPRFNMNLWKRSLEIFLPRSNLKDSKKQGPQG